MFVLCVLHSKDESHKPGQSGQRTKYEQSTKRKQKKIPVGVRFFAPVQTGPEAHPAYHKMGTGCLSRA